MNRIAVIGSSGSGKSTLSRQLSEALSIPVYHLDRLHWKPGWVESPLEEFVQAQQAVVAQERWIIDGNYSRTMDLRLKAADTIIWLDMPRYICLWRGAKRTVLARPRPDIPDGCEERLNLEFLAFLKWIWDYPRRSKPQTEARLRDLAAAKTVIRLRSPREVAAFLNRVRSERAAHQ